MFRKAIVLSPADFRILINDLLDYWRSDYADEIPLREFIIDEIEHLIENEKVDEIVVFLEGDAHVILDGEQFVDFMERAGYEDLLDEEGFSESRLSRRSRLKRRRKRI